MFDIKNTHCEYNKNVVSSKIAEVLQCSLLEQTVHPSSSLKSKFQQAHHAA